MSEESTTKRIHLRSAFDQPDKDVEKTVKQAGEPRIRLGMLTLIESFPRFRILLATIASPFTETELRLGGDRNRSSHLVITSSDHPHYNADSLVTTTQEV